MVDIQKVGAFIAQCRKEHNWTQKELGEKLGVTDKAISKWENGRSFPDITLLESLCETFDITVSELLSGKKIEPKDYKRETERLLIQSIGEKRLRGFQIGIYSSGAGNDYIGRHWLRYLGHSYFMEDRSGTHEMDFACSSPDHFWRHGILRPKSAREKLPQFHYMA